MKIKPNSTILFMGDSITDAGRSADGEPTPWEPGKGLGQGYVNLVNSLLTSVRPEARYRVLNRGTSGWTVRNLKEVWQAQVVESGTDWLSVMIGINDVWRQFDTPLRIETHVLHQEYAETLDSLLAAVRPKLKGLILMTPYVIERDRKDAMRVEIVRYGKTVEKLARKYDAVFVDTQAVFDTILAARHPAEIAWDRIHPGTVGHMALAKAWTDAVGFRL